MNCNKPHGNKPYTGKGGKKGGKGAKGTKGKPKPAY